MVFNNRVKLEYRRCNRRLVKNRGILILVTLAFCFTGSCGGDESPVELPSSPEIISISPNRGPVGTAVNIEGSGFSPVATENIVTFNDIEADVIASTPSSVEAFVPDGAATGPIEVTVDDQTATGPVFTVESQMPGISSVTPESGTIGTEVTIRGMNFSPNPSENTITFNGTEAPVDQASDTLLVTEVPDGATTGPVEVTVDGETATGPEFTVITEGTLQVLTSTDGSDIDSDGYTVAVSGAGTQNSEVNDTLYFSGLDEENYSVELMDAADNCTVSGENPRTVSVTAGDTTSTSYSVNCETILNSNIAFASSRDANFEIYVMDDTGANQTRITNDAANDEDPAISPDGSQIAFASNRDGNSEIYIINADGSNLVQVTNTSGVENSAPAWSPDGTQLAFTRFTGNQVLEIFIIDTDGTNETNVTNNTSGNDASPAWSPDGSRLAFMSDRGAEGDSEIWLVNTDGTGLSQLTDNDDTVSDGTPDWSPDGSQIAFSTDRDQDFEIYIMNADGSNATRITTTPGQDSQPSWSPGGTEIVFFSDRDANGEIYRIGTDGSGLTNLTVNASNEIDPDWSPVE